MSIEYRKGAVNAQMVVQSYEWGPAVPKVIVEFEDNVIVKTDGVEHVIKDVYHCDANGVKQRYVTKYLSIDMKVNTFFIKLLGASMGDASPFTYNIATELDLAPNMTFMVCETEYGVQNAWTPFTKNLMENYLVPETANWKKDSFTFTGITLQRAAFTPKGAETDGVKNPLIIWLHGAGEGGVDIDTALLGNKVTALAKKGIQKYFTTRKQKGAYVLAVQNPTMWMDKGDGSYNIDVEAGKRQTSIYDVALFAAIKDYVAHNKDIDTSRIYLGGCSNGGYMTMNLMFEHGDYFSAFYPICEAYSDENK
ncbi:hypothetical protein PIROE2DRAFT_13712 [Piromyces sp. E2]|nr:hypothetical protein PIROE2DRAFT_13712 [Piromyces sp. E2]|eukprot:OUM60516.1 hypothetical protein PIROE2DRAFT_13712 [Piromyces sp. E2]